jgi:hypothetical protein
MSKKKNKKFDLGNLVHDGWVKDGETFSFVSNPSMTFKVAKQPNGEYKITTHEGTTTVHAFAQKCLGTEPPDHASRWFKNKDGKTLYELWQMDLDQQEAA